MIFNKSYPNINTRPPIPHAPGEFGGNTSVYVVGTNDAIKIGVSRAVATRVKELQVGCPFRIKVYKVYRNAGFSQEKRIHDLLVDVSVGGEWFEKTDEIAAIINYSDDINHLIYALERRKETMDFLRQRKKSMGISNTPLIKPRYNLWGQIVNMDKAYDDNHAVGDFYVDRLIEEEHKKWAIPYAGALTASIGVLFSVNFVFPITLQTKFSKICIKNSITNDSVDVKVLSKDDLHKIERDSMYIHINGYDENDESVSEKIIEELRHRMFHFVKSNGVSALTEVLQLSIVQTGSGVPGGPINFDRTHAVFTFGYMSRV